MKLLLKKKYNGFYILYNLCKKPETDPAMGLKTRTNLLHLGLKQLM